MSSRRRPENRNLPENLYPNGKYFTYRNPITGKKTSLNVTRQVAISKAKKVNALIESSGNERAERQLNQILEKFTDNWVDPTQLYRHYAVDGTLLYVGISLSALNRLTGHKHSAKWFLAISHVTVETFPTRSQATSAEITAIKKEKPLFNIAGNKWKFRP